LNEIDEKGENFTENIEEEEAIFNNQLNEITENDYHENIISFIGENLEPKDTNKENLLLHMPRKHRKRLFIMNN
jgi:hypothetical protein